MSDETKPWKVDDTLERFTILHRELNEACMDFELYRVMGTFEDGKRCYQKQDGGPAPCSFTENPECYARGTVRFDGCVNYEHPGSEECMLHECGCGAFVELAMAWKRIYELAAEQMPEWAEFLE